MRLRHHADNSKVVLSVLRLRKDHVVGWPLRPGGNTFETQVSYHEFYKLHSLCTISEQGRRGGVVTETWWEHSSAARMLA